MICKHEPKANILNLFEMFYDNTIVMLLMLEMCRLQLLCQIQVNMILLVFFSQMIFQFLQNMMPMS